MSERIETGDDSRITRLPSKEALINFCYKDEHENPQTIRGLGPISIPDYQKFLEDSVREEKIPLPIYTHMTRLWDKVAVATTRESLTEEDKRSLPAAAAQDM